MGYSTARFVIEFNESFVCGICFDVFKDPVVIRDCEHVFCRDCLDTYINTFQSEPPTCPQDRTNFTKDSIVRPARYFMSLYENLKIKCNFLKSGCKEVTTLGNLADHLANCDFNTVDCEKDCGFSGYKKDLRIHDCVEYLKQRIHFMTQENEQRIAELTEKMEQELLKAKQNPDIEKFEEAIVKKAQNAIKELWTKIDYKEGVTRLWPHFVEEVDEDEDDYDDYSNTVTSLFRYVEYNEVFSSDEKEKIANATLKTIVKNQTFKEIAFQLYLKIRTIKFKKPDVSVYCNNLFGDYGSISGKFFNLFICDIEIHINY